MLMKIAEFTGTEMFDIMLAWFSTKRKDFGQLIVLLSFHTLSSISYDIFNVIGYFASVKKVHSEPRKNVFKYGTPSIFGMNIFKC